MANNNISPQESMEKMMEQGGTSDDAKKKMAQHMSQNGMTQIGGAAKTKSPSNGLNALGSLVDPDAWIKDLYGVPQSDKNNKQTQVSTGVNKLSSLSDPTTWSRSALGMSQIDSEHYKKSAMEKEQKRSEKNHTPLDMSKVYGPDDKHPITTEQKQFFKKYQQEYEQFLQEKKKKEENEKRRLEEEEKKRKEEEKKKKQEEENQVGGGQGKQKQKLGQPRRKATTELHPETKAGGAK